MLKKLVRRGESNRLLQGLVMSIYTLKTHPSGKDSVYLLDNAGRCLQGYEMKPYESALQCTMLLKSELSKSNGSGTSCALFKKNGENSSICFGTYTNPVTYNFNKDNTCLYNFMCSEIDYFV